jgi:hypothetical protein
MIKIGRRIFIVSIVCTIYILLSFFYYHIDKYLDGVDAIILTLLLPATFILIIIFAIKGLIEIYRNRKKLTFQFYLPTIIVLLTLTYTLFSPWRLDSENWENKVELRACYEGIQSQSTIKFRSDHSYEAHHQSFGSSWALGLWNRNGDTLFMNPTKGIDNFIKDTMVIRNEYLIPIGQVKLADSLKMYNRYYYLGYCKGLN